MGNRDDEHKLIRAAFAKAKRKSSSPVTAMSLAVLKSRLLHLKQRKFSPTGLPKRWNRGVGILSVNYAIAPGAFLNPPWLKGRQESTFQPADTVLFGISIGIHQ